MRNPGVKECLIEKVRFESRPEADEGEPNHEDIQGD
jgi:hypothetical protein